MNNKYAEIMDMAVAIFGSKRAEAILKAVAHPRGDTGIRVSVPLHIMEEVGIQNGNKVAMVMLPNGNTVLAPTRYGNTITVGAKAKAGSVTFSGLVIDGKDPVAATIQEGMIVFAPGSFKAV